MRLRVLRPSAVAVQAAVGRVRAEAPAPVGSFTLLPRHVDVVTPLSQGLLSYTQEDGHEVSLAVDGGTLVKVGDEIIVSTPNVVEGVGPEGLREAIAEHFGHEEEQDQRARTALDRIGADLVERLVELEELRRHD